MHRPVTCALASLAVLATVRPALPQDERELGWKDTAELSYVLTAGNSRSNTLGFRNLLTRTLPVSLLSFRVNGIRAVSTDISRKAVGEPGDFDVVETRNSRVSAENYLAALRYERNINHHLLLTSTASWERNRFSGIENRYVAGIGLGDRWYETSPLLWKTEYSLTWTSQEEVNREPLHFVGLRVLSDLTHKLSANASLQNLTIVDENLNNTSAWRIDTTTSLSATVTRRLALKAGLQLQYSNQPPQVPVALYDPITGADTGRKVNVDLLALDTTFTTSLVMNF